MSAELLVDLQSAATMPADQELTAWAAEQRVFISSAMATLVDEREAVAAAIDALGAEPVLFERFGGQDRDPVGQPGYEYEQPRVRGARFQSVGFRPVRSSKRYRCRAPQEPQVARDHSPSGPVPERTPALKTTAASHDGFTHARRTIGLSVGVFACSRSGDVVFTKARPSGLP